MAGDVGITSNAAEVARDLGQFGVRAERKARRVVEHHTMLLLTRVKANANLPASGPPGPRLITGDYNASWHMRIETSLTEIAGFVGTDRPQAMRLEYGFAGTDILGRRYNQPPYPHLRPAVDETTPGFLRDMQGIFTP